MIIRSLVLSAVVAASVALPSAVPVSAVPVSAVPASAVPAGASVRVGTQVLARCGTDTYCGTLRVPLDRQLAGSPDISVCYRWYPATGGGRASGTVMPVEGGPGTRRSGRCPGTGTPLCTGRY